MKNNIGLTCLILLLCSYSYGQMNQYGYRRELTGIKDQWHQVVLPDEIYGKISDDFSDIRIFGLTKSHDTIEAPYLLGFEAEKTAEKAVPYRLINESKNGKGYYFTFETPSENTVNQMDLEFKQENFDWRLNLEGSQNLQEWFSILEDYRILSLKNELTDFQFSKITFPGSRYRYFRLLIKSNDKPGLISAALALHEKIEGSYRNYMIRSTKIENEKLNIQTIIHLDLGLPVPVCRLKIGVKDTLDFYRPITIEYLSDSIKTPQGWKNNYRTLTSGMLTSLAREEFNFSSTILQKLRITINHHDNEPLHIDSIAVKGYIHKLIARFNVPATYYLTYGNDRAVKPNYDIERFTDKIPAAMATLNLGDEQSVTKDGKPTRTPLFQNKIWLWTIMGLIIILLGWFTVGMIRKK